MISRYSPEDVAQIWKDERKYTLWLEVELSALRAAEQMGVAPAGTAETVRKKVRVDAKAISALEHEVKHDVIAFVTHLERQCGTEGRWLHYGLTSSDVVDTATAIQIRESMDLVVARCQSLMVSLLSKIREHHDTPMIGRTHGVHAEPTTFGFVLANHYKELHRRCVRLGEAAANASVGKMSGAVGTRPHIPATYEVEHLRRLGLGVEDFASQVVTRDRHAEVISALALLGSSLERLAVNIRHLHRTEVGEVMEGFGKAQRGSSAMPHKQNPVSCENICGMARVLRGYVHPAMEDMILWHERDISHSSVERVILPDAFCAVSHMLDTAKSVVEGLRVDKRRMLENLEASLGGCMSGHVLLLLVRKGMGREEAYGAVKRASAASSNLGLPFADCIASELPAMNLLTKDEVDECVSWRGPVERASESVRAAYGEPAL